MIWSMVKDCQDREKGQSRRLQPQGDEPRALPLIHAALGRKTVEPRYHVCFLEPDHRSHAGLEGRGSYKAPPMPAGVTGIRSSWHV